MPKNKKNKKKILIIILSVTAFFLILFSLDLYFSNNTFTVTFYTVESEKITEPIRIVQLSDLHNKEFGESNSELLSEIKNLQPDIILTTGDMLDGYEEDSEIVKNILIKLNEIAPVYSSLGNHEGMYEKTFGKNASDVYKSAGGRLLEYEYTETEIKGNKIRIGGIYGYCQPDIYSGMSEVLLNEAKFVREFQNTEKYLILLCHMPYSFLENDAVNFWNVNLIFAGHAHGGQVRLPFIGGLYAPDQGYFPGEVSGLYYSDEKDKVMVLSRGLGSSKNIPRINNIPELTVTDIIPKEG